MKNSTPENLAKKNNNNNKSHDQKLNTLLGKWHSGQILGSLTQYLEFIRLVVKMLKRRQ